MNGTSTNFSTEVIFGFPVSSNNGNFQFGIHNIYYYQKYYWVEQGFIQLMDENDKRRTQLIYAGNPNITNPISKNEQTSFKFNNPNQRDDVSMMRLAEVYLNKAEALAKVNGINNESLDLLNEIRNRAGIDEVSASDFASDEAFVQAILNERHVEMAFEGMGRFDFIRTGRDLKNPDLSEEMKVLPIPKREVDLSKGTLKQNPGYGS